jgi:peptide deformylase
MSMLSFRALLLLCVASGINGLVLTTSCERSTVPTITGGVGELLRVHRWSRRCGRLLMDSDERNPGRVVGTDLRILEYPDPRLRASNTDVTSFKDYKLKKLVKEMFKVMYASRGVGLAAPQVGINQRLMVFNPTGDSTEASSEVVLCNPEITEVSEPTEVEVEGCLSFPGFTADVRRHSAIKVRYQNMKGKWLEETLVDWEARIFQHEYDHLTSTLYIDRLDASERARVQENLVELTDKFGPGGAP